MEDGPGKGRTSRSSPSSYSPYSPSVRERDGKVPVGDAEKHTKAGFGNLFLNQCEQLLSSTGVFSFFASV